MYRHLSSPGARQCPKCREATQARRLAQEVTVDVCPKCHGMWLNHGDLKVLLHGPVSERAHPRALSGADRTELRCPDCNLWLFRREFTPGSGVMIEQCSRCAGIFLDAGGLGRLQDFLRSLGPKRG